MMKKRLLYCPWASGLLRPVKARPRVREPSPPNTAVPGKKDARWPNNGVKEKSKARIVTRDEYQDYRDETGKRMSSPQGKEIYKQRAPVVEGSFAVIKHIMGVRHFLLRGLEKCPDRMELGMLGI